MYIPDLIAIAKFYKGWLHGGGLSSKNVMSYGDIPDKANDYSASNLLLPRVRSSMANLSKVMKSNLKDPEQIQEYVNHSGTSIRTKARVCTPSTVSPNRASCSAPTPRAPRPTSRSSTKAASIRGSRPRAGAATPWKSAAGPLIIGYAQGNKEFKDPVDALLKELDVPYRPVLDPRPAPRRVVWNASGRRTRCPTSSTS